MSTPGTPTAVVYADMEGEDVVTLRPMTPEHIRMLLRLVEDARALASEVRLPGPEISFADPVASFLDPSYEDDEVLLASAERVIALGAEWLATGATELDEQAGDSLARCTVTGSGVSWTANRALATGHRKLQSEEMSVGMLHYALLPHAAPEEAAELLESLARHAPKLCLNALEEGVRYAEGTPMPLDDSLIRKDILARLLGSTSPETRERVVRIIGRSRTVGRTRS